MSVAERVKALLADPRTTPILDAEIVLVVWPGANLLIVAGESILQSVLTTGIAAESRVGVVRCGSEFEALALRKHFDAVRNDSASVPSVASGD